MVLYRTHGICAGLGYLYSYLYSKVLFYMFVFILKYFCEKSKVFIFIFEYI